MSKAQNILLVVVLVVILGVAAAVYVHPHGDEATATTTSGIKGFVLVGPTCPVVRADTPCPDRPLATTVGVYDQTGNTLITQTTSGSDGAFLVDLVPGTYTLKRIAGSNAMLPRCNPTTVTVRDNAFATTTISCDSGIR